LIFCSITQSLDAIALVCTNVFPGKITAVR
jgi:hypothetical protein